ncbi:MAG: SCO family protein, partial [Gammaproteobacteria bacterium]|nr:SCO family protein [Candidatus Thiopontia autotrophica]
MYKWLYSSLRFSTASLVLLFLGVAQISLSATAEDNVFDHASALEKSRGAVGNLLSDYTFTDINGMPVHLESFRNKPLVVNLVYTSCYHICQMTTEHLKKMVAIANESLGSDKFNVITLGFDTMIDSPEMMEDYAKSRSIDIDNWYFLSGDGGSVKRFIEDVGFTYIKTTRGFDHILQATIVDQQGKIYTQVYGESYDAPLFMEPLKELVYKRPTNRGIVANIGDRVRFFCTVYDPASGG